MMIFYQLVGVYRGHYRTDTRGANLNRYYLNPDPLLHPSIYAAKSLIMHYHLLQDHHKECEASQKSKVVSSTKTCNLHAKSAVLPSNKNKDDCSSSRSTLLRASLSNLATRSHEGVKAAHLASPSSKSLCTKPGGDDDVVTCSRQSGIALYVDLHAHATRRGVFMYGNYFKEVEAATENMLFPKLLALNSPHLDFEQCVFSERNMYTADRRDGMSKEGSGRVAIHKATGIIPW